MGLMRIVCLNLSYRLLCDAFPMHCHLNITNLLGGVEQVYLPLPPVEKYIYPSPRFNSRENLDPERLKDFV